LSSEVRPGDEATDSERGFVASPLGDSSLSSQVEPASPLDRRLYDVQRCCLYGHPDADRPVSIDEVRSLAARHGAGQIVVGVDNEGLDPLGAVATPAERSLRFHQRSLTLWVAIHEVTHLLPRVAAGHGPEFVSAMAQVLDSECGQRCGDRFRAALLAYAVPRVPVEPGEGVFVLEAGGKFVAVTAKSVVLGHPGAASRMSSRSAAARTAGSVERVLGRDVDVVQLA